MLDEEIHRMVKMYAADKGMSIKAVMMKALGLLIKELNKEAKK